MRGGERQPIAASIISGAARTRQGTVPASSRDERDDYGRIHKLYQGTKQRFIEWINSGAQADEKQVRREYVVSEMYPRILYAFSDVVVFVLRNAR